MACPGAYPFDKPVFIHFYIDEIWKEISVYNFFIALTPEILIILEP